MNSNGSGTLIHINECARIKVGGTSSLLKYLVMAMV
jgi:hypothetical protein